MRPSYVQTVLGYLSPSARSFLLWVSQDAPSGNGVWAKGLVRCAV